MGSHGLNVAKKLPLSSTGMTPPEEVICNANNTMAVALPASPMKQVRALITHKNASPALTMVHLKAHGLTTFTCSTTNTVKRMSRHCSKTRLPGSSNLPSHWATGW